MTEPRDAPYPPDTRAKGWRFEIDYEKVDQSDTWSLASEIPMAQPALLMMWLMAWTQEPVGSFPNDENLIRVKCKIPPAMWAKIREVLMRGWWLAADGRLYHDTLVMRVEAMLVKRAKDAKRTANNRAHRAESGGSHGGVTRDMHVTNAGHEREFDTKHQAPSTSTREEKTPKAPRKRRALAAGLQVVSLDQLVLEGVQSQHAADWLAVRSKKDLPLTPTAWEGVKAEAAKAGMSAGEAVHAAAANGWGGFKESWLREAPANSSRAAAPVNKQEALEQSNRQIAARWAAKLDQHDEAI